MIFSYNWLQSFFNKKLFAPEKLAGLLTLHFAEVKEVRKEGGDFLLDIDIRPNRAADCFSHSGIARECATLLNLKLKTKNEKPQLKTKNFKTKDLLLVEVIDKMACLRYTVRVICDVKVGISPKWIRERLKACGLKSINNIVDIVNYVMLETGQPLHAFDFEKISGIQNQKHKSKIKNIIIRKAKKGEKITTLDNEKYDLDGSILVIADKEGLLAVAGIKGGKKAEIDMKTKKIVLESANFNPQIIRRGSKTIDLKTDASWRFEHGLDPNLTQFAVNRAAYLIQEIAGGRVAQGLTDVYPKKVLPKRINLDLDYIEKLLGIKIPAKEIIRILKSLGLKIAACEQWANCKLKILNVEVPTFRPDISLPEDLIEEIGRIYGYQKIPSIFPLTALIPPKRNLNVFWENNVKDILKNLSFSEVYNYSFLSEKEAKIFGYYGEELLEIENPISLDFQYLRPSLIPKLLKNIAHNERYFEDIKVFELGKIYIKKGKKKKIMLSGAMEGDKFYQAKGVVDSILEKLGINKVWYDEYEATSQESKAVIWRPKRTAEIKVDDKEIGFLGEISPRITEELGLKNKIVVFDLDFEVLANLASEEVIYQPVSSHPAVIRDIAILVPRQVRIEEVLNKIEIAAGSILRDVDLFDIYEGEELPTGKKNLAFRLIFQAKDKTLSSKEINELQKKIIESLEQELDWQVRKSI